MKKRKGSTIREGRVNADYQENTSEALWQEEWVGVRQS